MATVYLSLGTNLGDKEENLQEAIQKIEKQIGCIISQSAFYITEPWGFESNNTFLNAVVAVNTKLSPNALLITTQDIEKALGRKTKSINKAYKDRLIDIDILLYDQYIFQTEHLTIPHPFMTERLFVMEPLAEIAPLLVHPILNRNMQELLEDLKEK